MTKIKLAIFGFAALAIVTVLTLGYMHYQGKLNQIEQLTADNATLELAVETQQDTITAAEQTIRDWEEANRLLAERNEQLEGIATDARREQERIVRLFDELDIAGTAIEDPIALSDDLNRRFDFLNCMFEQSTGTGRGDCTSRLAAPATDAVP